MCIAHFIVLASSSIVGILCGKLRESETQYYLSTMKAVASEEIVTEPLEDSRQIQDPDFVNHGLSMLSFRLHHPYGFSVYMQDAAESIGRLKIDIFLTCPVMRPYLARPLHPDISAHFTKTVKNNTGCVWEFNCPYAYVQNEDYLYFVLMITFRNNTQYEIRNRAFFIYKNQTSLFTKSTSRKNGLYRIGIKDWPIL